jgi:hypothetical protein
MPQIKVGDGGQKNNTDRKNINPTSDDLFPQKQTNHGKILSVVLAFPPGK